MLLLPYVVILMSCSFNTFQMMSVCCAARKLFIAHTYTLLLFLSFHLWLLLILSYFAEPPVTMFLILIPVPKWFPQLYLLQNIHFSMLFLLIFSLCCFFWFFLCNKHEVKQMMSISISIDKDKFITMFSDMPGTYSQNLSP